MFGLTAKQSYCLAACFSDGYSEAEVGRWLGISRSAVAQHIRRACDKLANLGLPCPKPYGRGSRAELRAVLPAVVLKGDDPR